MSVDLYQILHVAGREPRLLSAHLRELTADFRRLYGREVKIEEEALRMAIGQLLDRERYPLNRSTYVTVRLDPSGNWRLSIEEESFYQGYVLRALRPDAITLRFDLPFAPCQSSVTQMTWQMARSIAWERGRRAVVRLDREGVMQEADGAPLFAAIGRTLYTTAEPRGVEGRIAREAILRAGYDLRIEPLHHMQLPHMEELFYVDYHGVTALGSCDGFPLMEAMAGQVAAAMKTLFR